MFLSGFGHRCWRGALRCAPIYGIFCSGFLFSASSMAAEVTQDFSARVKLFGTGTALPSRSAARQINGTDTPLSDFNFDVRLMWQADVGAVRFFADHTTTVVQGDTVGGTSAQQNLNQLTDNDNTRVADLTWELGGANGHRHVAWHRFDRLGFQLRQDNWSVTLGRQAVSWGNGFVFQPMDLFNPFTPTAVDKDYKPGNDLLLIERVSDNGSDLQLLAVGRRNAREELTGRAGSLAVRWRSALGEGEYEFIAGRHFGDEILGVGLRWPLGGALLRTDIVATRLYASKSTQVSAVVNTDYSFSLMQRNAYVFAEYAYNGFGTTGQTPALTELDPQLTTRLQRGELFNVQRSYLALGVSYQWHPLWTQSLTAIANLHDGSGVLVTQVNYERGDHQRLEFGVLASLGSPGDEYAGLFVVPESPGAPPPGGDRPLTAGGQNQAFARWVYYL